MPARNVRRKAPVEVLNRILALVEWRDAAQYESKADLDESTETMPLVRSTGWVYRKGEMVVVIATVHGPEWEGLDGPALAIPAGWVERIMALRSAKRLTADQLPEQE